MTKLSAVPSLAQKARKPDLLHAIVGEIGAEIIQRLLRAVAVGEHDLHAVGDLAGCAWLIVRRDEIALRVEADEACLVDGLAGARQEHIEHRQRAEDLALR